LQWQVQTFGSFVVKLWRCVQGLNVVHRNWR
jgi:hypothetical protein